MNPDNMNQPSGMPPVSPNPLPQSPLPEQHGMGGIIALVVIVLVLLAGGYFLMSKMNAGTVPMDATMPAGENTAGNPTMVGGDAQGSASADVDPNTVQGTSIELSDIEADLNATDLNTLSADLNAI